MSDQAGDPEPLPPRTPSKAKQRSVRKKNNPKKKDELEPSPHCTFDDGKPKS